MMKARIVGNIDTTPFLGSMWIWISQFTPAWWNSIRYIWITVIAVTVLIGMARGSITATTGSGALLIAFVMVVLVSGSVDRMNISITCALLFLGYPGACVDIDSCRLLQHGILDWTAVVSIAWPGSLCTVLRRHIHYPSGGAVLYCAIAPCTAPG